MRSIAGMEPAHILLKQHVIWVHVSLYLERKVLGASSEVVTPPPAKAVL